MIGVGIGVFVKGNRGGGKVGSAVNYAIFGTQFIFRLVVYKRKFVGERRSFRSGQTAFGHVHNVRTYGGLRVVHFVVAVSAQRVLFFGGKG